MPVWSASMQQTFEYYLVDPNTWYDTCLLDDAVSCDIDRDEDAETLGSATFELGSSKDECYIRVYLVTIQNGVTERHPLGTFLVQSTSSGTDGKKRTVTADAYTPLLELKENPPPLGYTVMKNDNIMQAACALAEENTRAPVVRSTSPKTLTDDFVANSNDKWLSFISDLIVRAKYKLGLDELSRIIFLPDQDLSSLQPVWSYDDDNCSILYPDINTDKDLYDVPNVVEVLYSTNRNCYYAKAVNDDPNSPTSTVNRGRVITKRITDPGFSGEATEQMVQEYANNMLVELSTIEHTITYTHGYCPVRLGDCVLINSKKAGLSYIKAKVIRQNIKCVPGCPVTETAVYTEKLWR